MKIKDLIKNISILEYINFNSKTYKIDIVHLCDNSLNKNLIKNSAFICIEGINFDSHTVVKTLENCGALFLICSKKVETKLPYIIVKDTREVLGMLANNFYDNPTSKFKLISVIGTNGKTSTTYFIQKLLKLNKINCGVIGTSGVYINNKRLNETLTTPDPLLLYKLFNSMVKAKCKIVVMEISAHAISLKKVKNLVSDICVFTNFSQDHLDFFKTMENYKNTKFSYFNSYNVKKAIINIDDKTGEELYLKIKDDICSKTYSLNKKADIYAKNLEFSLNKTSFDLILNDLPYKIITKTSCEFNVYNILSSVLCLKELGINFDICNCLNRLTNIKGRFNVYKLSKNKFIIIDYAHTPESLNQVLLNCKKLTNCNLVSLFGCPGNRDEEKREIMGKIAYKYCKKIYITSDNPKYENPLIICNEILLGAKEKGEIIEDRSKAVEKAIKNLKENEILLIAGKGVEKYQDINGIHFSYSDVKQVRKCIKTYKIK